ncbi:MAG: hypothetical protein JST80_13550 [Bdellovibrionales bacterium]|nr:hypothetical protein [Bdellovibrionales bacterium]
MGKNVEREDRKLVHSYSVNLERRNRPIWTLVIISAGIASVQTAFFEDLTKLWPSLRSVLPTASLIFFVLYFLFDRFFWKWRWVRFFFQISEPDISGEWHGTLKSSAIDAESPMKVSIKQTWSKMGITSPFEHSNSCSFSAVFFADKAQPRIIYNYENIPHIRQSETMTRHIGTVELFLSTNGDELVGTYFTSGERHTNGTIRLKKSNSARG